MAIGPREQQLRDMRAAQQKTSAVSPAKSKPSATAAAQPKESVMEKSATPAKKKTKSKKKSGGKKDAAAPRVKAAAAPKKETGVRAGSKLELVVGLLQRPQGCTTKDVLTATGWPSVSMPQMAKSAGLVLKKEKDGSVSRYRAA